MKRFIAIFISKYDVYAAKAVASGLFSGDSELRNNNLVAHIP